MMLLGVDIGGTAIKLGALTESGEILAREQLAFRKSMPFAELSGAILAACRDLESRTAQRAGSIGICTPGFPDPASGLLVDGGANVPALLDAPLREWLSNAMQMPVHIANDGIAATLGELHFGAGRGFRRFVLLTIGTGVGGAVALDGVIAAGSNGEPPELGAIVLDAKGATGLRTLEDLASAQAFRRVFETHAPGASAPDLPELFRRRDSEAAARAAINEVSGHIAHALGMLVNSLNLEACLIGGGVAGAGEELLGPIRARLPDFTWPLLLRSVKVLSASRGNDAGLLGAAWLARDSTHTSTLKAAVH